MPASFTRRRDLFLDAGFPDPDAALAGLARETAALGVARDWGAERGGLSRLREALAVRVARVPSDQARLARLVPAWLVERTGDLATALWLARAEHGEELDLAGWLLAVLDALAASGRAKDAVAYARFMLDLRFGWEELWRQPGIAYGFLKPREPNPLVWRLLEELSARSLRVRVMELGCGVGNDAFGFLGADVVESYVGVDLSQEALDAFAARVERDRPRVRPELRRGDFAQALREPPSGGRAANLVYSYSSLHYFSSSELSVIYESVRRMLLAGEGEGFFAFGMKGHDSVWDGQGLPLYRPDVWINWDGQSRWFPSREALVRQLDAAGFELRFHQLHDHWGYSEQGKRDVFHYVLCSPRP